MITLEKLARYETSYNELGDFEKEAIFGFIAKGFKKLRGLRQSTPVSQSVTKAPISGLRNMAEASLQRSQAELDNQMKQLRTYNNYLRVKLNEARAKKGLAPIMI